MDDPTRYSYQEMKECRLGDLMESPEWNIVMGANVEVCQWNVEAPS
jgi:hypothetical protein